MKVTKLLAPVLLLSLGVACGKTEQKSTEASVDFNRQSVSHIENPKISKNAEKAFQLIAARTPITVKTPAEISMKVALPIAQKLAAEAAAANAPAAQPAATTPDAPAPAQDQPALSSGIKAVDAICAKSYKALVATTQAELDAVHITAATNTACANVLVSTGASLLDQLDTLGDQVLISVNGGYALLSSSLYKQFLPSNPDVADQFFLNAIYSELTYNQTYFLPDANEKLDYINASIAEIKAKPEADLTQQDQLDLQMLQLSLDVQTDSVGKFGQRITKLNSLLNITNLAINVAYVGQYLGGAAAAPTTVSQGH